MSDALLLLMLNGLVWGLISALIALGLSIIFGLLDIVNVAHGELFMLGAVIAWYLLKTTDSFWLVLVVAPLLVAALGILIERTVIRSIDAARSMVATFGLSLILQESVRATFGSTPQRILPPFPQTVPIFGLNYSVYRLVAAGMALAAIVGLFLYLHRTRFGTWMRAVRQDREMATAMGIPTQRVFMVTFALGAGLAALGGVVATPITTVEFRIGLSVLPAAFIAVVIGGLGNLPGTAVAAVLLGEVESVATLVFSPTTARILSLVFMSVVLLVRPDGLFTPRSAR
jgi:branched-chain amino acid transport system permease protein